MASLTVLRMVSALVPPTTTARWYGGQAQVPISLSFGCDEGFEVLLVQDGGGLLVEVHLVGAAAAFGDEEEVVFVARCSAKRSICAGRLVAVFFSLNISSGAICE